MEKNENDKDDLKHLVSEIEQKFLEKLNKLEEMQHEIHRLQVENCKIAAEMHQYTWILDVLGKLVKKALPMSLVPTSFLKDSNGESPIESIFDDVP